MIKKNSFDEVRLVLAFIVLLAHTGTLIRNEKFSWLLHYFDSNFAVSGFFVISGYLVTKSFYSSRNSVEYLLKRIRRIYPAYLVVIIYCFAIGIFTNTNSFTDISYDINTYKYLISNAFFLNFLQYTIPGALIDNKVLALNGSLWTIKVELMLYFLVPFLCYLYTRLGRFQGYLVALVFGVLWFIYFSHYVNHPIGAILARQFPGQLPYFAMGSVLGFLSLRPLHCIIIVIFSVIYYFFLQPQISSMVINLGNMIIYPLLIIAIASTGALAIGIGRFGDLSYGVYLYHFPTIQLLEHFGFYDKNPFLAFIFGVLLTVALAFCSWHIVEKRFLKRSSRYS